MYPHEAENRWLIARARSHLVKKAWYFGTGLEGTTFCGRTFHLPTDLVQNAPDNRCKICIKHIAEPRTSILDSLDYVPSAYLVYADHIHDVVFWWDGEEDQIEARRGTRSEWIPVQGAPIGTGLKGQLRWFESLCRSHIRIRIAAGEEVVKGEGVAHTPRR